MSGVEWLLAHAAVMLASALQTATGAGLGLVAGPALLLAMGSADAVHVAILLNLVLSIALLPGERREVDSVRLRQLLFGTLAGLPFGVALVRLVDVSTLKIAAAIAICVASVQLALAARGARDRAAGHGAGIAFHGAGAASGAMAAGFAMPGPAALWALSHVGMPAARVRATLRAQFAIAYAAALALHAVTGIAWSDVTIGALVFAPALGIGAVAGYATRHRISERALRATLLALLAIMGVALFVDSIGTFAG